LGVGARNVLSGSVVALFGDLLCDLCAVVCVVIRIVFAKVLACLGYMFEYLILSVVLEQNRLWWYFGLLLSLFCTNFLLALCTLFEPLCPGGL